MERTSFCSIAIVFAMLVCVVNARMPLYIGSLQELTDLPHWYMPTLAVPKIVDMTIERINNASILKDYDLKVITKDVRWSSGLAAKRLMELMTEDPPKVAIFGPGFSNNLAVTAQIAPYFNTIEVAYYDTAAGIADQRLYPTLFSVNYNFEILNPVLIKLMDKFGWRRIATVANTGAMFTDSLTTLHTLLSDNNKTLVSTAVITSTEDNVPESINLFQQHDVRIILMAVKGDLAFKLYCEAYKRNMYGSGYVWVAIGPLFDYNVPEDDAFFRTLGCSREELAAASRGSFMLNYYVISSTDSTTSYGERPSTIVGELEDTFDIRLEAMSLYWRGGYGMAIDALWAIAYGLNNSLKYLEEKGLKLHEYNYSTDYLDAVMRGMNEVHFSGVSGPVSFGEKGQRIGLSYIQKVVNILNQTWIDVGKFDPETDNIKWLVPLDHIFEGSRAPMDRFMYVTQLVEESTSSCVVVLGLNTLGFILSCGFLIFNIYYRNQRSVKLSSPMLNNVIIAGCMLMYLVVVVAALRYVHIGDINTRNGLCMVHAWIFSLGFTLLFGAFFSKTYRVYVIFRNHKVNRKHIRDVHLLALLAGLVFVDVCILLPWSTLHPLQISEMVLNKVIDIKTNSIISEISQFCYNKNQAYYFAALYVYKGLLLAFGTFLAWETRQVSVPELNDSKQIGACIYNVVVVCLFGVPLAHVLPAGQETLMFVLEASLIIFCTTACQCIIFVPKLKFIKQVNPRFLTSQMTSRGTRATATNDDIATRSTDKNTDIKLFSVSQPEPSNGENELDMMRLENKGLRMQIAQESIAIAKLRRGLQQMTGNIHFYRSGSQYVLFKTDSTNDQSDKSVSNDTIYTGGC